VRRFTCRDKHCNWFGAEAGQALATSKRIAKLSFTGSGTGRKKYNAAENIIPVTMELGGKSPNIFFICSSR
jgi:aldehyde dehydrogenase (NAD+)/aldehyde dehydrogenase